MYILNNAISSHVVISRMMCAYFSSEIHTTRYAHFTNTNEQKKERKQYFENRSFRGVFFFGRIFIIRKYSSEFLVPRCRLLFYTPLPQHASPRTRITNYYYPFVVIYAFSTFFPLGCFQLTTAFVRVVALIGSSHSGAIDVIWHVHRISSIRRSVRMRSKCHAHGW